jgi:hypothetical protein
MINRQAAAVLIDQGESGAAYPDLFADLDALRNPPRKGGFAGPQLADKSNDLAALDKLSQPSAPAHGLAR